MNTVRVYLLLTVTAPLGCCAKSQNDNTHTNVIIQTTHGQLRGNSEKIQGRNTGTIDVDVFWGISYAKPPVGDLRFKRPQPSDSWNGVFEATTPPNTCVQVRGNDSILVGRPPNQLSEDCLYLNIWRPRCPDAGREMATMLWVHGGNFLTGSTVDPVYNGATLAALECVIVASVNYRLGPFGFMYLASEEIPGNMGLLDVALALKWVKDNVGNFGGNPGKITIFGQSAGAFMASMFLLSPLTRDLFNNAIIQSGNPLMKFSHQSETSALSAANKLATNVNCGSLDSPTVVQCLREVSATTLARSHALMATTDITYFMVPVTDRYFLPENPINLVFSGDVKRCSLLIGTTKDEGTFLLKQVLPKVYSFSIQNPPDLNDQQLFRTLAGLFTLVFKRQHINEIIASVTTLYEYHDLKNKVDNPSLTLLNYISRDILFACPAIAIANVYAAVFQNVYVYRYDYVRESSILPAWVGATHGSEVPLEFRTTTRAFPRISSNDAQLSETIMKLWANFARFGNPTPSDTMRPRWTQYSSEDPTVMVFSANEGQIIERVDQKYCDYWANIPFKYYLDN